MVSRGRARPLLLCLFVLLLLPLYLLLLSRAYRNANPVMPPDYGATHYGAQIIDPTETFRQRSAETCGYAALAFLLASFGFETNQNEIIDLSGGELTPLSMADMGEVASHFKLENQGLRVKSSYFLRNPAPGILHWEGNHFVVFFAWIEGKGALLFDPAYGIVLCDKSTLRKGWNGKLLYLYRST